MKKLLTLCLTLSLLFVQLVACGNVENSGEGTNEETENTEEQNETVEAATREIVDHDGNIVTVPATVERIAVCDIYPLPSVLAVFFDSAEKIVGIPTQSMTAAKNGLLSELYPEILNAKTDYINGTDVNLEELLKLKPDVVFYSAGSTKVGETLRNAGFAAVAVSASKWNYDAIETLNNWIAMLSQIFPENDRSALVKAYSENVLALVKKRTADLSDDEKQRLFFLFQYNDTMITTSGKHFFGQWWADAVGAVNVGEEMETDNSTAVNMEQVYKWNPDRILITNFNAAQPETLYENAVGNYDWSGISAVKDKKVSKMPLGMYRSYTCGVDTPITLLWMAKTVYPERFEDVDITEEVKDYYKTVFGIDLSTEQAQKIFAPSSDAAAFK